MQAEDLTQFVENMLTILNIINNILVFSTCSGYIRLQMMPLNERLRGIVNNYLNSLGKDF